jgi:thiazole synthase
MTDTPLIIAGQTYNSRLLVGSGKYQDLTETKLATEAAAAEIITVAIRRTNIGQDKNEPNLLEVINPDKYTILPNTAGCYNAKDAVRTCQLARESSGIIAQHPMFSNSLATIGSSLV